MAKLKKYRVAIVAEVESKNEILDFHSEVVKGLEKSELAFTTFDKLDIEELTYKNVDPRKL